MEDCRSKILGKENILSDLPSPHPVLGGGNDTIIAAACAHQQVLMQDILSKTIERQIWRKVRSRDFWPTCRRNWNDGDFITNLRVDRDAFLLIFCWKTDPLYSQRNDKNEAVHWCRWKSCYGVMAIRKWWLGLNNCAPAISNARTHEDV